MVKVVLENGVVFHEPPYTEAEEMEIYRTSGVVAFTRPARTAAAPPAGTMTEEQREEILDRAQIMMMAVLNKIEDPDLYEVMSDVAVEGMETFERSLRIMFDPVIIDASERQPLEPREPGE